MTKAMFFETRYMVDKADQIYQEFRGNRMDFVQSTKTLGILIGDMLSFLRQIPSATNKALAIFGKIKHSYLNKKP